MAYDADQKSETSDSSMEETKKLLNLAQEQFKNCVAAERENRENILDDQKFYMGSPDNCWQWPADVKKLRESDTAGARPTLTINRLPHIVNQITNETRQNKPAIKVIPVNDDGDAKASEIYSGIVRHIEYMSDADIAYETANEQQTVGGIGYIRVLTEYSDDKNFDQDIRIRRVRNSLSVYLDPDIQQPDGSDAKFAFVTELLGEEEFKAQYPDAEAESWDMAIGDIKQLWFDNGKIRIAEWWRIEESYETLKLWPNGQQTVGDVDVTLMGLEEGAEPIKTREVCIRKVLCRKITGSQILEETQWMGKYIPIARVVGNEFDIEGKVVVSGLVRNAKDAQRMYNYWVSQEAEMLALAPKAPFVGYDGQFEGHEEKWKQANIVNYPYLEVNPIVDPIAKTVLPLPQRLAPPMPSAGILTAKQGAADDLRATTGKYEASLGMQGNETSERAINTRQMEGDISTYHYSGNLARGIRFVGRILLDLIPKIYDTRRVIRIIGEDGEFDFVAIDPSQQQALHEQRDQQTGQLIGKVFNPNVGKYDIAISVGPSFTTKRREALRAMDTMVQSNPALWGVIGDLLVKNMDWPGSQQMAERLKATLSPAVADVVRQQEEKTGQMVVPPQLKAQMMQMSQQLQQAIQQLQHSGLENEKLKVQLQSDTQAATAKVHDADTKLIGTLAKAKSAETVARIKHGAEIHGQTMEHAMEFARPALLPRARPNGEGPTGENT